jgi:hypothetical protein
MANSIDTSQGSGSGTVARVSAPKRLRPNVSTDFHPGLIVTDLDPLWQPSLTRFLDVEAAVDETAEDLESEEEGEDSDLGKCPMG